MTSPALGSKLWLALVALLALASAIVLAQEQWGLPGWTDVVELDQAKIELKQDENSIRFRLPEKYRRSLSAERCQLLRDGKPWGIRARTNDQVRERGNGRFRVKGDYLRFSTEGNLPLADESHRYSLRLPAIPDTAILPALLIALVLAGAFALRKAAVRELWNGLANSPVRPAREATILFLLAFAVRLVVLWGAGGHLDSGGLVVNGMPYSDSIAWNELAISLKEGNGITGPFFSHRPFYSVFLAICYSIFGESVTLAKLVNCLSGALSTSMVYLLVALGFRNRVAGLGVAALVGFGVANLEWVHLLVTEDLGFAFTALCLYLLWAAYDRGSWMLFLLAGIFFGLSNLTRTLTIFALPIYFLPLLLFWRQDRGAWKKYALWGGMICLGVALTFGPWIVRQKIQYDMLTISSNSADLLYCAANPKWGRWHSEAYEEAKLVGAYEDVTLRHKFFNHRLKEVILEDPARYVNFLTAKSVEFVNLFSPSYAFVRLLAALSLLAVALSIAGRTSSPASLVAFAVLLPAWGWLGTLPNLVLLPLSLVVVALSYRNRRAWLALSILAGTLVGCIAMSAVVGNFGHLRSAPFVRWIMTAIHLLAMIAVLQHLSALLQRILQKAYPTLDDNASHEAPGRSWSAFPKWSSRALVAFSAVGLAIVGIKNIGDRNQHEPHRLAAETSAEIEDWFESSFPQADAATLKAKNLLFAEPILADTYSCRILAGEDVDHWSRLFEVRDYDRTVVLGRVGLDVRVRDHLLRSAQIPGLISAQDLVQPLVLVGVENIKLLDRIEFGHEDQIVEAVGLFPYDPETGKVDISRNLVSAPSPTAMELMRE